MSAAILPFPTIKRRTEVQYLMLIQQRRYRLIEEHRNAMVALSGAVEADDEALELEAWANIDRTWAALSRARGIK